MGSGSRLNRLRALLNLTGMLPEGEASSMGQLCTLLQTKGPAARPGERALMVNRSESGGFIVSEEWLMKWRTFGGGWTKAQFHALGLKFCPKQGWKERLIGREISMEAKDGFEKGRDVRVMLDPTNKFHQRIIARREREWNQPL